MEAICDLLIEEDLQLSFTGTFIDSTAIADFQTHRLNMVASDAMLVGDHLSPMAYGTYPHVLGDMVREERRMSLPEAVRKMTSYPAQRLGLSDRGLLVDGAKADVVVFDPDSVRANATDAEPHQLSTGVDYVIVNGRIVIDQGAHTGALPRPRPPPRRLSLLRLRSAMRSKTSAPDAGSSLRSMELMLNGSPRLIYRSQLVKSVPITHTCNNSRGIQPLRSLPYRGTTPSSVSLPNDGGIAPVRLL